MFTSGNSFFNVDKESEEDLIPKMCLDREKVLHTESVLANLLKDCIDLFEKCFSNKKATPSTN